MTPTHKLASAAIDAAVGGDRVEYLNREINLFKAARSYAVSPDAVDRIDASIKRMERELYDLNTLSRIRREGY